MEPADRRVPQLPLCPAPAASYRLHEMPDVVAEVETQEDGPFQPGGTGIEQRRTRRPRVPIDQGELVRIVARELAEDACEVVLVVPEEMDPERTGSRGDGCGVVLLRDAREKTRREDAALGDEARKAPAVLPAVRRGDDVQRIVHPADQRRSSDGGNTNLLGSPISLTAGGHVSPCPLLDARVSRRL
jgi:hypothetical protein